MHASGIGDHASLVSLIHVTNIQAKIGINCRPAYVTSWKRISACGHRHLRLVQGTESELASHQVVPIIKRSSWIILSKLWKGWGDSFVIGEIVMRRSNIIGLMWVLLSGCATFSRPDTASRMDIPVRDTTPVTSQQMQLLVPGDWYAIRLPEREGSSSAARGIIYSGYVGRLQKSDEESLTLTELTKCTMFDSRSALRHVPLVGSSFENGWLDCKDEPGIITIPRSKVMWFEPISAEKAEQFRRYDETMNSSFELPEIDTSNAPTAQFGVLDNRFPNVDFLLPNPKSEEVRSRRWIEVREMKTGQWYSVITPRQMQGGPNDMNMHVGLVYHVDEDSVTLTDVTTGSPLPGSPAGSKASSEMMLRFSQIDRAIPLTPDQAAEQIARFNHP